MGFLIPLEGCNGARLAGTGDVDEAAQAYVRRFSQDNVLSAGKDAVMHAEMGYFLIATEGSEWQ